MDALRDILQRGGDTDTNGAIIGGLLGATQGIEAIDEKMLSKVLNFNAKKHNCSMIPELLPTNNNLISMLKKVNEHCPDHLSLVWGDKFFQNNEKLREHF